MKSLKFIFPVLIAALGWSCVSTKKYQELETQKAFFQAEAAKLDGLRAEKDQCESDKAKVQAQLRNTIQNLEDITARGQTLERSNRDLLKRYEDLLQQNKSLLSASSTEIKTLTEQLSRQSDELDRKGKRLDSLQREVQLRESELNNWMTRINDLQTALNTKEAKVAELRSKINQALVGLSASDLTVTPGNGKLYVSLSQNLLFKSGSDNIDPKGKDALRQLAMVLNANPDIEVLVEGHTDNVGSAELNWDLSTSRATSVVKVLASNGVDQKRMTAAGRSLFQPVAPNDSADNKSRNRRVEIVLSPKLDELYEIIKD